MFPKLFCLNVLKFSPKLPFFKNKPIGLNLARKYHFSGTQFVCGRQTDRRTDGRTGGHTLLKSCENASRHVVAVGTVNSWGVRSCGSRKMWNVDDCGRWLWSSWHWFSKACSLAKRLMKFHNFLTFEKMIISSVFYGNDVVCFQKSSREFSSRSK